MPYAYRKSERIRKNTEFVSTMQGKRLSFDGLSLFYTDNGKTDFRVGIAVGKKLANAATRNRLKRRIRNCVMKALAGHALGYDLIFAARRELLAAGFDRIRAAVETVLRRTVLRSPGKRGEAA